MKVKVYRNDTIGMEHEVVLKLDACDFYDSYEKTDQLERQCRKIPGFDLIDTGLMVIEHATPEATAKLREVLNLNFLDHQIDWRI